MCPRIRSENTATSSRKTTGVAHTVCPRDRAAVGLDVTLKCPLHQTKYRCPTQPSNKSPPES